MPVADTSVLSENQPRPMVAAKIAKTTKNAASSMPRSDEFFFDTAFPPFR